LLDQLQQETELTDLLNHILVGGTPLLYGIQVPIEILKPLNKQLPTISSIVPPILTIIIKRLNNFHEVLNTFPNHIITTTVGDINPPVGNNRIKVIELFVYLIQCNYKIITSEIIKTGVIATCLTLFFQFYWNNLLHQLVLNLIQRILEGESDDLRLELLKPENKLIDQIIEANSKNIEMLSKPKGYGLGFMGHITMISRAITRAGEKYPEIIGSQLMKNEKWQQYVSSVLMEIIKIESMPLGGYKPLAIKDDRSFNSGVFDRTDPLSDEKR